MSEFKRVYTEKALTFIGDIPCAAHIINLVANDIMKACSLNASKNDEIAIYINEIEELAKKKAANDDSEPSKLINILINFLVTY